MDILPLHIEYLLTRHDCVIVPGLGAFIATEREAYIDYETGMICPRRREISFNSSVVTDDGLLSHSIARRGHLAYEEARKLTAQLAERLCADLHKEGEVSLGMTGKLVVDDEGLISFQPRRSAIISDILDAVKLSQKLESPAAIGEEKTAETLADAKDEDTDGMRIIRVRADRYVFTVPKRVVHTAAMFVAILAVGLSLVLPVNHDEEQKASVISIDEFFYRKPTPKAMKAQSTEGFLTEENDTTAVETSPSEM